MKSNHTVLPVAILLLAVACDFDSRGKEYRDVGKFATKREAQNKALERLQSDFNALPENGDYKVAYSFPDTIDTQSGKRATMKRHAIWYTKSSQSLGVEVDIYSGTSCRWRNVDQRVVQQAVAAQRGIAGVDSLAQATSSSVSGCL